MPHDLEDVDLSSHALDVRLIFNFVFLEDFNCNLFSCQDVSSQADLSESALPEGPTFAK